jgi:hypothetical protein
MPGLPAPVQHLRSLLLRLPAHTAAYAARPHCHRPLPGPVATPGRVGKKPGLKKTSPVGFFGFFFFFFFVFFWFFGVFWVFWVFVFFWFFHIFAQKREFLGFF